MSSTPNDPQDPAGVPSEQEPSERDLEELARSLSGGVGLARALLSGNGREGEDASQDVWLAAVERTPKVRTGLRAWFLGALRRRALHRLRQERRRSARSLEELDWEPADNSQRPSDAQERRELREILVEEVMALPQPYRSALYLRYLEELSPAQVAEQLQRPLSTVQTQLQRGLVLLRTRLAARASRRGDDWTQWMASLVGAAGWSPKRPRGDGVAAKDSWIGSPVAWVGAGALGLGLLGWMVWGPFGADRKPAALSSDLPVASTPSHTNSQAHTPSSPTARALGSQELRAPTPAHVSSSEPSSPPSWTLSVYSAEDGRLLPDAEVQSPSQGTLTASADGSVRVVGLGPSSVRISAPGFLPQAVRGPDTEIHRSAFLEPLAVLEVTWPGGEPPVRARLWPAGRFPYDVPPRELALVEGNPPTLRAEVAPGRYMVSAWDAQRGRMDGALVELAPRATTHWQAFSADETTLVVDAQQSPPPGVLWTAHLVLLPEEQPIAAAPLGPDGLATLHSVPSGSFRLSVNGPTGMLHHAKVEIVDGQAEASHRFALPQAEVEVHVTDPAENAATLQLIGPEGLRRVAMGTSATFSHLAPGNYELWLRVPGALARQEFELDANESQVISLHRRAGADAVVTYIGRSPLANHEVVLVSPRGAELPILVGEEFGSASFDLWEVSAGEPDSPYGTARVSLPAGMYQVRTSIEGVAFPDRTLRLQPGEHVDFRAPETSTERTLVLMVGQRPFAHQGVWLQGWRSGQSPYSLRPGALWMFEGKTDASGAVHLPLPAGQWNLTTAAGRLVPFSITPNAMRLHLDFLAQ